MNNAKTSNKGSCRVSCLLAVVMALSYMAPVSAADAEKDAKREARRAQAQFAAAQKENAILEAQIDVLKKQLGELGTKSALLEKKSGGQHKQFAELTEKYQEADKNLQLMTQQFSDASKTLQQLQKEKELEQKQLAGNIQVCEKKNAQLYQISTELMEKYKNKGVISALLQAEPFTQLAKVKMENVLQEYKDKAQDAQIPLPQSKLNLSVGDVTDGVSGKPPANDSGNATASAPVTVSSISRKDAPQP